MLTHGQSQIPFHQCQQWHDGFLEVNQDSVETRGEFSMPTFPAHAFSLPLVTIHWQQGGEGRQRSWDAGSLPESGSCPGQCCNSTCGGHSVLALHLNPTPPASRWPCITSHQSEIRFHVFIKNWVCQGDPSPVSCSIISLEGLWRKAGGSSTVQNAKLHVLKNPISAVLPKAAGLTTVLLFRTSSAWGGGNIRSTGLNISLLAFTTPETSYRGFKRIKSLNLSNSFSWFARAAKDGVGLSLANKWFCFIAPHRTTWPNELRLWALGSLASLPSSAVWRKG